MSGPAAVLRFSRDRRGYEHFYLMQPERHGKGPARILYWFRTPPGIKVGRAPFDDELKRKIEAQNPGVTFDWPRLVATPMPPPAPEPERWRERRQIERAEKAARAARQADLGTVEVEDTVPQSSEDSLAPANTAVSQEPVAAQPEGAQVPGPSGQPKRRRRRRRRGHGPRPGAAVPPSEPSPADTGSSNE